MSLISAYQKAVFLGSILCLVSHLHVIVSPPLQKCKQLLLISTEHGSFFSDVVWIEPEKLT